MQPPPFRPYSDIEGFKPWMTHNASSFRRLLLRHGFEWRCDRCSITEWQGESAPLQIDHINGDRENNLKSNLRFLCPNCHALTATYGSRNRKRVKVSDEQIIAAYDQARIASDQVTVTAVLRVMQRRSRNRAEYDRVVSVCSAAGREITSPFSLRKPRLEKINWPSDASLETMLRYHSRVVVGRMLGVSDNAVKKRVASRGLTEPSHRRSPSGSTRALACADRDECLEGSLHRRLDMLATRHGTKAGYAMEVRLGVPTCALCREAVAQASRDRRLAQTGRTTLEKRNEALNSMHGTRAGYLLERRLGLKTCLSCRQANAASAAEHRRRKELDQA